MTDLAQTPCPPAFWLEAACAGEPVPADVSAHLPSCPKCQRRREALAEGSEAYQRAHPPAAFREHVLARRSTPRRRVPLPWALVPIAAFGLALWVGLPHSPGVRWKGAAFRVFYRRAGDPQPLLPGTRLRPGDALRFSYAAPAEGYLLVLDLDGRRRVQAFYPYNGAEAARVQPRDNPLLSGSVALDDSPGPEFLMSVYRHQPFTVSSISRELTWDGRSAPTLSCQDCKVELLRIEKEP